jgi:hypothetical protein
MVLAGVVQERYPQPYGNGDLIGIEFDIDAGVIGCTKNGTTTVNSQSFSFSFKLQAGSTTTSLLRAPY